MRGIVVLAASNYSLYSIMVAEGLVAQGIPVDRIVIKKLFNLKRVWAEVKLGPNRFVNKVVNKLIFRNTKNKVHHKSSIVAKFADGGFSSRSLTELGAEAGIPITYCDDFHSESVLADMRSSEPALIAFTGGGIVRASLLEVASRGVLNCHMGILPEYRGMDCYVWAILNGDVDKVGLTVHFMDKGIDTGPIIAKKYLSIDGFFSVAGIEAALEASMPEVMIQALGMVYKGTNKKEMQFSAQGKQYFIPVDSLREIAEYKLSQESGQKNER